MPTQTTVDSPYQQHSRALREAKKRDAGRQEIDEKHRLDVDEASLLDTRASKLEGQIQTYDSDENFRERVAEERRAFRRKIAIRATLVLIFLADLFLATPSVTGMLAGNAMAFVPRDWCVIGENGPEPAIWLRLAAASLLVTAFLAITLWIKKGSNTSALEAARYAVQPGDSASHRRLTISIWMRRVLTGAYLAALATLLFQLYRFEGRRMEVMMIDRMVEERSKDVQRPRLSLSGTATAKADDSKAKASAEVAAQDAKNAAHDLAKASAVVFCTLWILHAVLLTIPTTGSGRDLPYARFRRSALEEKTTAMRETEVPLLRNIYERIRTAPLEQRDDLIQAALPVIPRINEVYGRRVISVPLPDEDREDGAAPSLAIVAPDEPLAPAGNVAASIPRPDETDDSQEAPANAYDAIFPAASLA